MRTLLKRKNKNHVNLQKKANVILLSKMQFHNLTSIDGRRIFLGEFAYRGKERARMGLIPACVDHTCWVVTEQAVGSQCRLSCASYSCSKSLEVSHIFHHLCCTTSAE